MTKTTKASMNVELQKWLNESRDKVKTSKNKKSKSKKKPSGKCQICGEKTAEHICIKCEKSVCKSCYFKIIGICKKCIPPRIRGKWDGSYIDWEKELGVEWVG
jgi:hypothetical protein